MATVSRPLSSSSPTGIIFNKPASSRLMSLDIFRGLCVAGMIVVDNPGNDTKAYWPIMHADWNGWTPADFIFPSFLFLVGISLVFSTASRLQRGQSRSQILVHALWRTLLLIAIGLLVNASPIVGFDIHTFRFEGVTQRIALCYLAAVALELWSGRRGQVIALAACVIGYWAIMRFVPVPGYGVPGRDIPFMDPDRNLAAWLDRKLFMGHLYNVTRDPEGILHTIPAIGTTLAGVLTGHWLRSVKSQAAKAWGMFLVGIVGLCAGLLWNRWFPINKNLWTSSFVLFTAGFALVFLALLYWILEIRQWRGAWTMPILVLGMNAITAFVADAVVYGPGYSFNAKGPNGTSMPWHEAAQAYLESFGLSTPTASLIYSLAALSFCWFLLWLLWRKRVFIKV
jgi:predicted acyltransferase